MVSSSDTWMVCPAGDGAAIPVPDPQCGSVLLWLAHRPVRGLLRQRLQTGLQDQGETALYRSHHVYHPVRKAQMPPNGFA